MSILTGIQALHTKGTSFTGTMIKNRVHLPDVVRTPSFSMQGNETKAFRAESLLAVAWRAANKKKPLIILSSNSVHQSVTVRSRRATQQKPMLVDQYNHSMNGMDGADQYTVYYSFIRRRVKWWRKVFFWLLEVAEVNSYICTNVL